MNGFQYINAFGNVRSGFSSLPPLARLLVMVLAVPGLLLLLLSIVMLAVSIIALLLLTVPVYRLLRLVCFSRAMAQEQGGSPDDMPPSPGRRQVDAKVIE